MEILVQSLYIVHYISQRMSQKVQKEVLDEDQFRIQNCKPSSNQSQTVPCKTHTQKYSPHHHFQSHLTPQLSSQVDSIQSTTDGCCGLLRVNYYNTCGQLTAINYASAFAVSKRIILTCTHNIYDQHSRQYASSIQFWPGAIQGPLSKYRSYKSCSHPFYKCDIPQGIIRSINQLTLIVLQQQLDLEQFITIRSCDERVEKGQQVKLIGYPNKWYCEETNNRYVQVNRLIQTGNIHSLNQILINYQIRTSKGLSGSPVLIYNGHSWRAIGIHIKRGDEEAYNTGLLFNLAMVSKIKAFETALKRIHKIDSYITYQSPNSSDTKQQASSTLQYGGWNDFQVEISFSEISTERADYLKLEDISQ